VRRAIVTIATAAILTLSACGSLPSPSPTPAEVSVPKRGLKTELPAGWHRAESSLTPRLSDPREVLSVGTFQLRYRRTRCAGVPGSALADLGPTDALVTIQERGKAARPAMWAGFPQRPPHFGPHLGNSFEGAQCVPTGRFTDHWIAFTDGDRHFHVLVAFGPDASEVTRGQAWHILDSLQIDPAVRPDWRASG
jgi:hypothetical protein